LVESIGQLGGDKIKTFISQALSHMDVLLGFFSTVSKSSIRRLSNFADKEGKTRIIGIGDYFSQTVLRRLHLYLFDVLKKIPQDVTFDQGKFKSLITDWDIYYSVDLSAATDRFPISIIEGLLRSHFPVKYVDA
jgi:hypothetical protein